MEQKGQFNVGIDLGTTFSEIGHINGAGIPEIITGLDGKQKRASIVSYAGKKSIAGADAKLDLILSPKYVIKSGKRHMGKETSDGKPIPILTDPSGRQITALEFSAAVLRRLKESAESYLDGEVENAVITVPAYFDEVARNHTIASGKMAGFKNVRLLDEPVAAAICYGLEKARNEIIVVVDFGGGTLDITAIEIAGSDIKAIVTDGDCELGGTNYDEVILGLMRQQASKAGFEISAEKDLATYYQNLDRATESKESLGQRDEVVIIIEAEGKRTTLKLDRNLFKKHTKDLDKRFIDYCKKVREELVARNKKPDRIISVGGSCRLFHVSEMIQGVFGIEPSHDTDPDLVVAKGAAIWAEKCFGSEDKPIYLNGNKYLPGDIKAQTVTAHAICIAACNSTDRMDPEEYNVEIIPANSALPNVFEERFAPVNPSQRSVDVKIVQGKSGEKSKNSTLLRKIVVPIHPSDKDTDRILVKGKYNEDALLEITVIDELSGKPVSDSFVYSAGLGANEIDMKIQELKSQIGG